MSLRPPSSPSPSPGPGDHSNNGGHNKLASRQSLGPSTVVGGRPGGFSAAPGSPRLASGPMGGSGARPTSELVGAGSAGMYNQTPEAEALDAWFENLQNYEATLEDMAAASLDVNFKEELSAIEQWFKVLSEAERTAALYSLLQHSTQVQIRFFITVLQQMARSDPMTALLSPAVGGSMQQQMEAKLASLKSPGLKSNLPASPTTRNFANTPGNRSSLDASAYLSPDSASLDAASMLAQQRGKLKASTNVAHRISAPIMPIGGGAGDRNTWGAGGLSQVVETNRAASPAADHERSSPRPKSTEFTGRVVAAQEATVPAHAASESWASMVTTPALGGSMFAKTEPKPEPVKQPAMPGVPRMGDPTIHRRAPPGRQQNEYEENNNNNRMGMGMGMGMGRPPPQQNQPGNWQTSPPPNHPNNRFGGSDDGRGFNPGMQNPFAGVNMNMLAMGISPETQLLAAQMAQAQIAAAGGFAGMNGMGMGVAGAPWLAGQRAGMGMGMGGMNMMGGMAGRPPNSARTPRSAASNTSGFTSSTSTPKNEDDVDPALLNDIPAWLRSLRLHKYTPNFEGARWQEMVMMDEPALEAKGVAALGARRKMLKSFEIVRKKMGIEGGPPSLPVTPGRAL